MLHKTARPASAGGANRSGLVDDLRVAAESGATYHNSTQKQIGLRQEYLAALRSTKFSDLAGLVAAGVRWKAIANTGPALAPIRVSEDATTFEPDDEGGSAFIIPARADNPITPEAFDPAVTVSEGAIVDLVAFHPRHPSRWALRIGSAEWLGAIEPQYLDPMPVPVWRTPLTWLRAGCPGLVLLGDRASQYRILTLLHSIIAEDERHAAELRSVLSRPWPVPQVISFRAETRHAA